MDCGCNHNNEYRPPAPRNHFSPDNRFVGDIEDGFRYPFGCYTKCEADRIFVKKSEIPDIPAIEQLEAEIETKADKSTVDALEATVDSISEQIADGVQSKLSTTNKLDPNYINYDSSHRAVSDAEKNAWNAKQTALSSSQLSAVNSGIDAEKVAQIATNTSDISALQTGVASKASQASVTALGETVESKADVEDIADLQQQINNIITPVTQEAEVQNARVGGDGSTYATLKARLDAESAETKNSFESLVTDGTINIAPYTISSPTWVQGVINGETGENAESTTRIRSGYIGNIVKVTPAPGAKFYPVFYRSNVFVSSETWHTTTAVYDLEALGANQVRIVLAASDDSTITTDYASNITVETKSTDMRSAMFRGTLETLSYSKVQDCKKEGYYTYTYQTAANLLDIPDDFKDAAGIVEVFAHITASDNATVFQYLRSSSGKNAYRWVRVSGDVKGAWIRDNSYKFLGTLETLEITDLDDCKADGYYTVTATSTQAIDNYPEKFVNSAGVIQVFANVRTADQKTWIQVVTNSGGDTATRYIREYGTKGDWVYNTGKPNFQWYALGDSITQGYYSTGKNAMAITTENWVKFAAQRMGCTVTNYGIGGSGYMDNVHATDHKNAKEKVADIDFAGADLVTLAYGVNDWKYGYPLGSMADDVAGGTSVIANMRYVIEKIISDNPNCKIIVITPLNCRGYDYNYGSEATNYGLGYVIPENGKTLQDFFNGIKEVCEYYGIEMIDLSHNSVVNRKSIVSLLKDGVHPSLECHKALGHELGKKINFD